jgi:hypothetical protein
MSTINAQLAAEYEQLHNAWLDLARSNPGKAALAKWESSKDGKRMQQLSNILHMPTRQRLAFQD